MDFGFKNYNITTNNAKICKICTRNLMLPRTCDLCKSSVCMNNCGKILPPEFKSNRPYLIGINYLCNDCIDSINPQDENVKISNDLTKKIFANIFSPEENNNIIENTLELDNLSSKDNLPEVDNPIKSDNIEDIDNFIKVILNDLTIHNQITFDDNGNLSTDSERKIINSWQNILQNAILS